MDWKYTANQYNKITNIWIMKHEMLLVIVQMLGL